MKGVLTIAVTAVVSSVATVALMRALPDAHASAPRQDKEFSAERFVLVDGKGDPKAFLASNKNGEPFVAMLDGHGKVRIVMGTKDDMPTLSFTDSKGRAVISLAVTKDDRPALEMGDSKGQTLMSLGVVDSDHVRFVLLDKNAKPKASLHVEKGKGLLELNGSKRED
jgi:hypothetical protein